MLEPVLAKLARPGMANPDDPESPTDDVESPDLAPKHIDRGRKPWINPRHHLGELIAEVLDHARTRREAELRHNRGRERGGQGGGGDDDLP